jgi:hypothetical protein
MHHELGLVGILVGLASPALGQSRRAVTLSDWVPPPGVRCGDDTLNRAPPIGEVLDTARLREEAEPLWRGAGNKRRHVLLTMAIDSTATRREARILETGLADSITTAITSAAQSSLLPLPNRWFRLRIDGPTPLRFTLGNTEECAPALKNEAVIARVMRSDDLGRALYDAGLRAPTTVTAEFVIDTTGHAERQLTLSPYLNADIDRIVEYLVKESRFHPGTVERRPIRVLVRQRYYLVPIAR